VPGAGIGAVVGDAHAGGLRPVVETHRRGETGAAFLR